MNSNVILNILIWQFISMLQFQFLEWLSFSLAASIPQHKAEAHISTKANERVAVLFRANKRTVNQLKSQQNEMKTLSCVTPDIWQQRAYKNWFLFTFCFQSALSSSAFRKFCDFRLLWGFFLLHQSLCLIVKTRRKYFLLLRDPCVGAPR